MSVDQMEAVEQKEKKDVKSNKSKITYSKRWMTPENAAAILSLYEKTDKNLEALKKDKDVLLYAREMENGAWVYNAMPIIFDTDGTLVDGFKRLAASVISGQKFYTNVAENARKDTLHTIGQHRKRSFTGILQARGFANAAGIQNTMSKLIRYENGLLGIESFPISWARYEIVLDANPEIIEATRMSEEYKSCSLHSTPRPVLIFMAIRAGLKTEIIKFLDIMSSDLHERVNAATKLSEQMKTMRANKTPYGVDVALAMSINAFNDYCDNAVQKKPYKWAPKTVKLTRPDGTFYSVAERRKRSPANLGMPRVMNYPGIREGLYDTSKNSDMIVSDTVTKKLQKGVKHNEDADDTVPVLVTPEMAQEWLINNNEGNRKQQKTHIDIIARDIKAGNWMVNAQPISFSGDPFGSDPSKANLMNGQHRLGAIVASGMAVEIPIAANVPVEAFLTYDKEKKKDNSKGLKGDSRAVRAAAKFQWRVDMDWDPLARRSPSETELRETIKKHPELTDYFHDARKYNKLGSAGVMTFFLYHIFSYNKALSREFLDGMMTGDNLAADNPLRDLRSPFVGDRPWGNRNVYLSKLLNAWDEFLIFKGEKEPIKEINTVDSKEKEESGDTQESLI